MGTYHSMDGEDTQREPSSSGSSTLTREGVRSLFDYCLANPKEGIASISMKYGLGRTTAQTWIAAPAHLTVNKYLVEWFQEDGHLERWLRIRRRNTLNPRLLEAIGKGHQAAPDPEPVDVGGERLIGPTGIGTFVPVATDDLLVMREEALRVKTEAEAVATEASILAIAIDTVRDWLTDKDKLQQALGRVQSLEAQLKATDDIVKRFQQQKLATDQVHSRD
jgi:hypothetical protein